MTKRMVLMLAVMLLLLGGIFGFKFYQLGRMRQMMAAQRPPPVTVAADVAREDHWQPALRTTGSLVAVQGVVLSNELAGVVRTIAFESGGVTQKGDVLVQLDTSTDEAQLHASTAAGELARQNLERARKLRTSDVNAQADLDAAQAQYDQAAASIELVRATIAKKVIRAPFTGRLGLRQVNLGQFLPVGTMIVALQSFDPIYVNFALAQQDVRNLAAGQKVELRLDAFPGAVFAGTVTAFDSTLDPATRTVRVQATFANADSRLQPGMFGNVAVLLPQLDRVLTVPQSAIAYNPYGDVVYVIETAGNGPDAPLVVRQQFVKLGDTRGDQVAVVSGLKPGTRIVTGGQLKLRDGVTVRIDNATPAANNPSPNPPNA